MREAWFDQTWGGYRQTTEFARDLAPGKHRVASEILPEKNPQSTGHEYRVLALGRREWQEYTNGSRRDQDDVWGGE